MSAFDSFLATLGGRAPDSGVAAMGIAQSPTDDELAEDSAERAEHAGDGPDIEPVYEPARPVTDETHLTLITEVVRSLLLGVPVPAASVALATTLVAATPVQVVPASGDRARTITLATSGDVYISPDRRQDETGFLLTSGNPLTTSTQGPVYAYSAAGTPTVSAWVDHYDTPTG